MYQGWLSTEQIVPSGIPVIPRSGRLCLPQGQVLDFTLSSLFLSLLQNTLNSLCFSPLPLQHPLSSISEATFLSTSNLFSSTTAQSFLLFSATLYLSCLLGILLVSTSILSFLLSDSNFLPPIRHIKLLLPMFS